MKTTERSAQPDRDGLRDLEQAETAAERELERMTRATEKRRKELYRLRDRARKVRRRMVRDNFIDIGEEAVKRGIDVMALGDLAADKRAALFDRVLAVLHEELDGTDRAARGEGGHGKKEGLSSPASRASCQKS